jgi:UTP--glucose-1-phosphate uridylyltransferase
VKTLDPGDPSTPEVIQIETAMGAAVEVFEGTQLIEVGRDRFVPVKTTNDLLVLRSDVYEIDEFNRVGVAAARPMADVPFVDLDPAHYKLMADFDARFPAGPPSLVHAQRFVVRGDVTFGAEVVVRGDVRIDAG